MADDRLKPQRDALILACEGYDADEAIRGMASALMTLIIGLLPIGLRRIKRSIVAAGD